MDGVTNPNDGGPRKLYELSDEDAVVAFEAIAGRRLSALCECDYDVGFTCDRCKASTRRMARDNDDGGAEYRRQAETIERYAAKLQRKAVR